MINLICAGLILLAALVWFARRHKTVIARQNTQPPLWYRVCERCGWTGPKRGSREEVDL